MSSNQDNDVINLKQIILLLKDYVSEIFKNWKLISIIAILCACLFALKNYFESPQYVANLSYMLEDSENSGGGVTGLTSLLGSFGFGSDQSINRDKLIELAQSERLLKSTLLKRVEIDEKMDFIANHIIDQYDYVGKWNKKEENLLYNFRFSHDSISLFKKKENLAIKVLRSKINGSAKNNIKGLVTPDYSEKSGILYLSSNTVNPELSIHLVEELYRNLDTFFVTKTIEKQKQNFDIIKSKTDSLSTSIQNIEFELAQFKDKERNLFRSVDRVKEQRLQNKIRIGYLALGKAYENLEIADYSLRYKKPLLSILDHPYLPLQNKKKPIILSIILGFIFGCILSVGFIVLRKKYQEIMSN